MVALERQVAGGWLVIDEQRDWRRLAACKGPYSELFFPPVATERKEDKHAREADAKAICAECVVVNDCLDHAISVEESHGIWGGLNELERRMYVAKQAVMIR